MEKTTPPDTRITIEPNTASEDATAITRGLASHSSPVIAGVLGMNFDAPFFKTAALGFWVAIGGMLVVTVIASIVGKYKKWF